MDTNSDDDALELPKPKNNKETLDALKSLKKEKQALPKRQQTEKQKEQFAKAKQVRDENRALRAEAKELLMKDKQSVVYTKEQKKAFKAKELEELKVLLGKNKEQEQNEIKPVVKPEQTNKSKKVIEELVSEEESETESESEEEVVVVKKKPKPRLKETKKKKKKVTVYMSSSDDDSDSSDEEPAPKQIKSRVQRTNQVYPQQVAPIDYKSFFV